MSSFVDEFARILADCPNAHPPELFRTVSDDFWLWANTDGPHECPELRRFIPDVPGPEVQELWTGKSGIATMTEGFEIYRFIRDTAVRHLGDLRHQRAVLDFGCGWGRVIRYFVKDVEPGNLMGSDYDASLAAFASKTNPSCKILTNGAKPPLQLEDRSVSLLYAYSVFSHFSEGMHRLWLEEFRRVMSPGGLLVLTVRPRSYIEQKIRLRATSSAPVGVSALARTVRARGRACLRKARRHPVGEITKRRVAPIAAEMFLDGQHALDRYDNGEFCFSPYDGNDEAAWWGEACIPRRYVETQWSTLFDVIDFTGVRGPLRQHAVVLRAR